MLYNNSASNNTKNYRNDVKFDLKSNADDNYNSYDVKHNKSSSSSSSSRTRLPAPMIDRSQISIWSILKQFIGKELSKITMPAAWCEPLSFLQRITENVSYSELIEKASNQADPCKRMEYIAAYSVSSISSNIDRLSKPFNPLLGETYELIREDLGFRIISEQVSHHPPVSAFHVDSTKEENKWKCYGCVCPKIKFWGKSIDITPKGLITVELHSQKETYTWQTVNCCVHNIIVGKLWFEHYGTLEIICHESGYKAVLNFKPYSWSNREVNKVEGYIYDNKKNKIKALYGYWTHCFYSCDVEFYENYLKLHKEMPTIHIDDCLRPKPYSKTVNTYQLNNQLKHHHSDSEFAYYFDNDSNQFKDKEISKQDENTSTSLPADSAALAQIFELWRVKPMPDYASDYYNFSYFAMCLNEMKKEYEGFIAPTDSRYRADIRLLENGDLDAAAKEKLRLEEKQREARKNRKEEFKPMWFEPSKNQINGEDTWNFTDKYWYRDFSDCPNLF